jgi:hypothetical protein
MAASLRDVSLNLPLRFDEVRLAQMTAKAQGLPLALPVTKHEYERDNLDVATGISPLYLESCGLSWWVVFAIIAYIRTMRADDLAPGFSSEGEMATYIAFSPKTSDFITRLGTMLADGDTLDECVLVFRQLLAAQRKGPRKTGCRLLLCVHEGSLQ